MIYGYLMALTAAIGAICSFLQGETGHWVVFYVPSATSIACMHDSAHPLQMHIPWEDFASAPTIALDRWQNAQRAIISRSI